MLRFLLIFILFYISILGDWNILKQGKIKGNIDDLFFSNNSIYIGGDYLYRSYLPVQDFEKIYSQDFVKFSSNSKKIFALRYKDDDIFYSDDEGMSWQAVKYGGKSIYWKNIFTIDDSITIAIGDTIIKTVDNGKTWEIWANDLEEIDNYTFYDLYFYNDSGGVIAGKNRKNKKIYIFRTSDNGKAWDTVYISSKTSYTKIDIFFINPSKGWISLSTSYGCDSLYVTNDSGKTWDGIYYYKDSDLRPTNLFFISEDTGFAAGRIRSPSKPCIIKTVDGGRSWKLLDTLEQKPMSLVVRDDIIYIGCYYGVLEKYENDELINLSSNSESFQYTWISASSDKATFFIGNYDNYSILRTVDFGRSFTKIFTPFKPYRIYFLNDFYGIGISSSGKKLYYTETGGDSWEYFNNSFSTAWRDIIFLNNETGWILGDSLLQTNNGGKEWSDISNKLPSNIMLRKGIVVDNKIYMCGYDEVNKSAIILLSEDSCNTFHVLYNSSGYAYYIHFVNNKIGYCANKYRLLKTVDSGITWDTVYTFPTSEYIYTIYFYNPDIGWVGTDEGNVYKTLDGGRFFENDITHDDHINHFCYSNKTLFVTGDNGFIARRDLDSLRVILKKGWHLLSFPIDLFNNTFDNISDDIRPFYNANNNSNIYIWNESNSSYIVPEYLSKDHAYFIYVWDDSTILDLYGELIKDSSFTFNITNTSDSEYCGLNLIPNPYNYTIDFELIRLTSSIENKYWVWTDSGYAFYPNGGRSRFIYPMEAFWVYSTKRNDVLTISKPYEYIPKMNKYKFDLLWRLKVIQGNTVDANNFLGLYKNAADTLDLYDMKEVPSLSENRLNLSFLCNDLELTQCINKTSISWIGKIYSNMFDSVQLYFYPVISNAERLTFVANNESFEISDTASITLMKRDSIMLFSVFVNDYTSIEEYKKGTQINKIICYPNPCGDYFYINNNTDINYNILYIYDISGRLLFKNLIKLDRNSIIKIDSFRDFPSGIYLIRLKGCGTMKVFKIVKMK